MLKKIPPKGKKLLIIGTTSRREVLDQMEMISAFTKVLHVPQVREPEEVVAVCRESELVPAALLPQLHTRLTGPDGGLSGIGVKKLLGLLDLASQTEEAGRLDKLIAELEEEMSTTFSGAQM